MKTRPNIVVADIGNTTARLGFARGPAILRTAVLPTSSAAPCVLREALRGLVRRDPVAGTVLCSVVPAATSAWRAELGRLAGQPPMEVSHRLKLGIRLGYPEPRTIGADRLANACAGYDRYGGPVLLADFGTAATFDVVTADGSFVGGVIAPGPAVMTEYLADRTALLPRIRFEEPCGSDRAKYYGTSTLSSMRIGAWLGYLGLVNGIVAHMLAAPELRGARLLATGGHARSLASFLTASFVVDLELTLRGLAKIYLLNAGVTTRAKGTEA